MRVGWGNHCPYYKRNNHNTKTKENPIDQTDKIELLNAGKK